MQQMFRSSNTINYPDWTTIKYSPQFGPENKNLLTSTPLMDQYFHQTYDRLEAIRQFNPNSFRYSGFQSIINDNKKDNLTEE